MKKIAIVLSSIAAVSASQPNDVNAHQVGQLSNTTVYEYTTDNRSLFLGPVVFQHDQYSVHARICENNSLYSKWKSRIRLDCPRAILSEFTHLGIYLNNVPTIDVTDPNFLALWRRYGIEWRLVEDA
ncbi:MAG: hypothetical protein CNLJKLNK_00060 [Holosporales bacterium]